MARREEGKKFETLEYHDREDGVRIKVPVRMVKSARSNYADTDRDARFEFVVTMPDFAIHDRDKDLNALRDRVFEEIKKKRSTTWEDFLHVFAGGDFPTTGDYANSQPDSYAFAEEGCEFVSLDVALKLDVRPVRVGTRYDGTKVHTEDRSHHTSEGLPRLGPGEEPWSGHSNRTRGIYSLIPDTLENRAALVEIVKAMEKVHEMLRHIVHPDNIHRTLEMIKQGGGLALPAPAAPAAQPAIEIEARTSKPRKRKERR
jgi:hypothetical protein